MSTDKLPQRRVYDFLPPPAPGRQTYLLPVTLYRVLVPCVERSGINALEQAVLRLAQFSCCGEKDVAEALCMDEQESSLIHFIQNNLAQRGLLEETTLGLTVMGEELLKSESKGKVSQQAATLVVEEAGGSLLPVILAGILPSYPINKGQYVKENSKLRATCLKKLCEAAPPEVEKVALALRRMQRDNWRAGASQSPCFFRPDNKGALSWQLAETTGEAAYLAVSVRLDAYGEENNELLLVDDFFGRGNSPFCSQLINRHYPEIRAEVISRQMTEKTELKGKELEVFGFSPHLAVAHRELARALHFSLLESRHPGQRLADAYGAAEHLFHALLKEFPQPELAGNFSGDTGQNELLVLGFAAKLGLDTRNIHLFQGLRLSSIRALLNGGEPPNMRTALACCLAAASGDTTHPLRRVAISNPLLLQMLNSLRNQRNAILHGAQEQDRPSGTPADIPQKIRAIAVSLLPQYADNKSGDIYSGGSRQQRIINAWGNLYKCLGESTVQHLQQCAPTMLPPLLSSMEELEMQNYSHAITHVASAFQELLHQLCLSFPVLPDVENISKATITERCRECGLLAPGKQLPLTLSTVGLHRMHRALQLAPSTLGGYTLAFAAMAPAEALCQLAKEGIHLLADMERLCLLRKHGNTSTASSEEYQRSCSHLLTHRYLITLTHSTNH